MVWAGSEVDPGACPSIAAVVNFEGPRTVNNQLFIVGIAHLRNKLAAVRIVCVDMAIAEIPDPQCVRQSTKTVPARVPCPRENSAGRAAGIVEGIRR